ncbi:MAG TPA: NlpC/P60 family protein [Chitinophagaceae bacterium]|nr:NlpC/P60 family protein [Chitinophagaceae bacterium]
MKKTIPLLGLLGMLASCSSLKPVAGGSGQSGHGTVVRKSPEFLDQIEVTAGTAPGGPAGSGRSGSEMRTDTRSTDPASGTGIEQSTALQFKYAQLLNTEVEEVRNLRLYQYIDEWYGTRYCLGGTTKNCIDCSAFVQSFYSAIYNTTLPRTARDQYRAARKISATELQEGDLLFFNTRGGISHVGIYLQNNKFVHASTTGGVMISDRFDPYYVRHFVGAGRIDKADGIAGK